MNQHIKAQLDEIRKDRESGAMELAGKGVRLMEEFTLSLPKDMGFSDVMDKVFGVAKSLAEMRPSMAPIGAYAFLFVNELDGRCDKASEVAMKLLSRMKKSADNIVKNTESILKSAAYVFTLSYSSTVAKILTDATPKKVLITVAEGRPLFEGRKLAEVLIASGRDVRLVTDAQTALAVKGSDIVLIGADSVLADLSVINKVGSVSAALAALEYGKPLYVACDTLKIDPHVTLENAKLEEKDGGEVWAEKPELCANVYFEPVPAKLVTGYITEKGVLNYAEMKKEVDLLKGLWSK